MTRGQAPSSGAHVLAQRSFLCFSQLDPDGLAQFKVKVSPHVTIAMFNHVRGLVPVHVIVFLLLALLSQPTRIIHV